MTRPELKTRRPTGLPWWPIILLAGTEKSGKSYASAEFSASDLIARTFYLEVGEGAADLYGALPGARFEIVEHDGSFNSIGLMARLATEQPAGEDGRPNALVIDSMTEVWDLLTDEQQQLANRRAAQKGRRPSPGTEAVISADQWNAAKKRWRRLLDVLRGHTGPVILTARLDHANVVGHDGSPTGEQRARVRAEKNLPYDVDAVIEMPRPGTAYLTGVRSLHLHAPAGEHRPYKDFTIDRLLRDMGLAGTTVADRAYTAPDAEAYATSAEGRHDQLVSNVHDPAQRRAVRTKPAGPEPDPWTTPADPAGDPA